jgi:hypothetical protein
MIPVCFLGSKMRFSTAANSIFIVIALVELVVVACFAQNQIIPLTSAHCTPGTPELNIACHWQHNLCQTGATAYMSSPPRSCSGDCATWREQHGKCQACFVTTYTECCTGYMTMDPPCQNQLTSSIYETSDTMQGCDCCP